MRVETTRRRHGAPSRPGYRTRQRVAAFAAAVMALATILVALPATSGADTASAVGTESTPAVDGLTPETAAASCWEIKQLSPAAADGVYWLHTPALGEAQQFYCDQSTDGGGWVLVGRGREWWSNSNEGRGEAADVWSQPSGPSAFAPRQLSSRTIGALLDGGRVDALPDGVRLRRATNTAGTSWQEARFTFRSARQDWSWQFSSLTQIDRWRIGTSSGSGGTTADFGTGSGTSRIDTRIDGTRSWAPGFGFGSGTRGDPAASSYLWSPATNRGYARPF
ncbi:MAG: fibrinogen-like YCDxxxxGGGW domain-containing protein, partial [Propionicimonas sp.]|nr:fibrinogen-like YCDxxxxGGGW domain-containing protein [Propionicimonas sp.]